MRLDGRRVLVTGASRGIGEATARAFAAAGARVALVARSEATIKELAAELGGTAHPADLSKSAQVADLVERVEADGGPVDVLVNNAGVAAPGTFDTLDPAAIDDVYRVNLLAPVHLSRQVLPGMLQRGRGHIVNVSSLAGAGNLAGMVPYSSTKSGLNHFTAGLRADLKGTPIGTTLLELGPIPSEILEHVNSCRQTELGFRRFYRLRLIVDVPREEVARQLVAAVERGRKHVRIPRRSRLFPLLAEAPRRLAEVILVGVPARDR